MPSHYSNLLRNPLEVIKEPTQSYYYIKERHLQAMWLEQKYFKNFKTTDDLPIQVISPGIWNAEAGPDFLKAHLKIGDKELFGDIELHLSHESWTHHHHHLDARYNNVILHISLWDPKKWKLVETLDGKSIQQTSLEQYLTLPISRILQLVDLDLYPYKRFAGSGKCAQTLFRSMPNQKMEELFTSAALWRLQKKGSNLSSLTENNQLRMGMGIATALGYKSNTEPFQELLLTLEPLKQHTEDEMIAYGLKLTGFFSDYYQKNGNILKSTRLYMRLVKCYTLIKIQSP